MDPTAPSGCGLTVLRTGIGSRATKTWRWNAQKSEWSKVSYNAGAWFTARECTFSNLPELAALIEKTQRDSAAFVVRGALTPEVAEAVTRDRDHKIRRRKLARGDVSPSLVEVPRRWLICDIDGWPLPDWADLVDDPGLVIDHAVHELLPEAFHDAECFWQLSSSAGFSAGFLKVHLFFWLSEPATNEHIKKVLKQCAPAIDRAPFSAAQPIYVAAPVIEGGYDPLPRRTGWRKGLEQEVVLPELKTESAKPRAVGTGATGRVGGIAEALLFLGDGEGGEGFHAPLRTAIMRYAIRCSRYGQRDDEALKAQLRDAIRAAPARQDRDPEQPYCTDAYLNASIAGAFALLAGQEEVQTMAPHHQAPANTVEQAREELKRLVGEYFGRVLAWHLLDDEQKAIQPAEHSALVVDVGAGKTKVTREALAAFIEAAKAAGLPHRVLWLVPTHKLGNETLAAMQQLGLNVAVLRGREAIDPETGNPEIDEPAQQMCLNIDAVQDSLDCGYDIEKSACGSGEPGTLTCPYFAQCGYQRQKTSVANADVIITSHQSLFHAMTRPARNGLAAVVVDESWWQSGVRPNQSIPFGAFVEQPRVHPVLIERKTARDRYSYKIDEIGTNDLLVLSQKLETALATVKADGFLSRDAVVAAGLSVLDCVLAIELEWRRKKQGLIWPGQALKQRRKAVIEAAANLTIPRRVAIWKAVRDLLAGTETHTGRLQTGHQTDREGNTFPTIVFHGRATVRDKIAGLPILCLDATMPIAVVRNYLPCIDVLAEIRVAAPHMTVRQVVGGWGKTSLVPYKPEGKARDRQLTAAMEAENSRRLGLVGDLADFVRAKGGGKSLVVTYQAIEDQFAGIRGVRTGHFNAISGLDQFKDVRSLFVIGRPLPDPRELRLMALALTGRPIPEEEAQRETRGALMADGTGAAISVRAYADPDLEAVRTAISDAEVIQAIGRGRAINRTANSPLDVWVMADVCLPLPVNELVRWVDVRLDVVARMAAQGCVFFSPSDAARVFDDLFPTPDAARMAINRVLAGGAATDFPNIPLGDTLLRGMFGKSPRMVTYRPAGRGQQTRRALVAEWRLEGLRDWLDDKIGLLIAFDVAESPEPPPPPPSPSATTPPPTPTPPSPEDGDVPAFEQDDPGWTADPWHPAAPPDHEQDWDRSGMAEYLARGADDG